MVKPLATLVHMPWHILQRIVDSADAVSRFSLRKCSRGMRNLVDSSSVHYHRVSLGLFDDGSLFLKLTLNEGQDVANSRKITIKYFPHSEGCVIRNGEWEKLFEGKDPMAMAALDFSTIFSSPKVCVRTLEIKIEYPIDPPPQETIEKGVLAISNIQEHLSKMRHKCHIGRLLNNIPTSVDLLVKLLSCFIPGTLGKLDVRLCEGHEEVGALTSSEHWKQAEGLYYTADSCPINEMAHFRFLMVFGHEVRQREVEIFVKMAMDLGERFKYLAIHGLAYGDRTERHRYFSQFIPHDQNVYLIERPDSSIVLSLRVFGNILILNPFRGDR